MIGIPNLESWPRITPVLRGTIAPQWSYSHVTLRAVCRRTMVVPVLQMASQVCSKRHRGPILDLLYASDGRTARKAKGARQERHVRSLDQSLRTNATTTQRRSTRQAEKMLELGRTEGQDEDAQAFWRGEPQFCGIVPALTGSLMRQESFVLSFYQCGSDEISQREGTMAIQRERYDLHPLFLIPSPRASHRCFFSVFISESFGLLCFNTGCSNITSHPTFFFGLRFWNSHFWPYCPICRSLFNLLEAVPTALYVSP